MTANKTASAVDVAARRKTRAKVPRRPTDTGPPGVDARDPSQHELDNLRMLLRVSPIGIFRSDTQGTNIFVGGQLYGALGFTAEQTKGDGWIRLLHPDDREDILVAWTTAVSGGGPFTREFRMCADNGAVRWVLTRAEPIHDAGGAFAGHIGTVTDITDQKGLEGALRESEERHRFLYEESPAMLHSLDGEGRLIGVSNRWLQVLGYEREEVIGRRSVDFMTDASRRHARDVALPEFARTGVCRDIPRQFVKKTGQVIEVLLSAVAQRGADGRILRALAVLVDATERRRAEDAARASEARLKALVDHSPMTILVKDVEGRYLLVNREFERRHGVRNDDIRGKRAHDIFSRETADTYAAMDRATLATAAPVEREMEWATPEGPRIFACVKFPIYDSTGTPVGLGCVESDITDRKIVERELRAAKDQAEHATRAKSEFLANMSHELRTPLNAIIGFSELMKDELFGALGADCYREYASDIHSSGSHLLELINDILDLSKIEAGKVELHEDPCDIADLVAVVVRFILGRAQSKGLLVDSRPDAGLPRLWADRRLLRQVLLNLLSNAVKFTPRGGRITVSAGLAEDGGLCLSVADTGIGMAPEDVPRALEPFEQIESAFNRRHEGSGLGLPLAKALVELHGGSLRLQSELGSGTAAVIRFPPERVVGRDLSEVPS